uniref:Rho GTPase activating protein 15 n=1 Tax=Sphenodon punctatus TaxID=8508 RepID=A0A8D0GS49_SPHPU
FAHMLYIQYVDSFQVGSSSNESSVSVLVKSYMSQHEICFPFPGLDVDGIYRVSGNLATIQKLRFVVNQEEKLNLDDSQWEDIHVVTGALKMFFRELPEPLFPYCFFEHFVEAIKNQDDSIRIKSIKALVQKLPRSNYDTMKILFKHLKKIAAKESANLMSTQSLGIVFGPTLLRPEKESGSMAVHMLYQNQLVELMLSEYSKIFEAEED